MNAYMITGTSSGLGKALFDLLCKQEVYLICISRRFLSYQEELAQNNNRLFFIKKDLSKVEDFIEGHFFSNIPFSDIERLVFINNAGVIEPIGSIGQLDSYKIMDSIFVNIAAPILITNHLIREKKRYQFQFSLVNISSGAANKPIDGWAMYCATKAGSKMYFQVLDTQFHTEESVIVSNIDPGTIDTNMQEKIRSVDDKSFPDKPIFMNLKENGELKAPEDVAKRILKDFANL